MLKMAIITGFLSKTKDRFHEYNAPLALDEKFALMAEIDGYDGVEIMGSEGYLINQFIAPATNQRSDRWGGAYENRIRLPLEIVRRVRQQVGSDFIIIFRLSMLDLITGGSSGIGYMQFQGGGLRPARTGMNRENGVSVGVGTAQHVAELQPVEFPVKLLDLVLDFVLEFLVLGIGEENRHLEQVVHSSGQLGPGFRPGRSCLCR